MTAPLPEKTDIETTAQGAVQGIDPAAFTGHSTGTDPSAPAPQKSVETVERTDRTYTADEMSKVIDEAAKRRLELKEMRQELAEAEARAKQAAEVAATEAAARSRDELTQSLGRALGLVKDDDAPPPDPAELLKQLEATKAEIERQAQASADEAAKANRELALHRALHAAAEPAGADPAALMDSMTFMNSLAGLDPAAEDYASRVQEAVANAAESNPRFRRARQAPVVARSGGDHSAGNGDPQSGGERPVSVEDLIKESTGGKIRGRRRHFGGNVHSSGHSTEPPPNWFGG